MPLVSLSASLIPASCHCFQLSSGMCHLRPVARSLVQTFRTSFKKVFNMQPLQTFLDNTYFIALLKMRKERKDCLADSG